MSLRRLSLLLALTWMTFLFYLSHQTGIDAPALLPGQDKIAHAVVYGVLAALILAALRPAETGYTRRQILSSAAVASLYGISDEAHQFFVPGRSVEILDWVADTTGAVIAALALAALVRRARKSRLPVQQQ